MFRYVVGDELFFDVLKQYAEDTVNFKYKTAVTEDFIAKVNDVTSGNYSWFFNEWLYYPDHPNYQNTYNFEDIGNGNWRVNFRARQTQPMTYFKMPLELKIKFTDQSDTLLRVMNDANLQWFSFNFTKQPIQLVFDPNDNIVLKQGSTVVGIDEMKKTEGLYVAQNIPNPFENNTVIGYLIPDLSNVTISLYNLMGQKITTLLNEKQKAGSHIYTFNAGNLKTGVYYYRIEACGQVKIMKMIVVK
jgi:aminopeptidase N